MLIALLIGVVQHSHREDFLFSSMQFFWLVDEGSIDDRLDCAIVRDSEKMHSFQSCDSSTLTIWT